MIVEEQTYQYSVDIGRPTFYTDEDRAFYKKVFELVETSSIPIVVNNAYHWVRDLCYKDGGYGGGSFAFCFFFATKEDRKEFGRLMKEIDFNITDWRNVMFHQTLDKKLHVRFDEKYLPFAETFAAGTTVTVAPYMVPSTIEELNSFNTPDGPKATFVVPGMYLASGDPKDVYQLKIYLDEQFWEFERPQ